MRAIWAPRPAPTRTYRPASPLYRVLRVGANDEICRCMRAPAPNPKCLVIRLWRLGLRHTCACSAPPSMRLPSCKLRAALPFHRHSDTMRCKGGALVALIAPREQRARPQCHGQRSGARCPTRVRRSDPECASLTPAAHVWTYIRARRALGRRPASRSTPLECIALARGAAADDPVAPPHARDAERSGARATRSALSSPCHVLVLMLRAARPGQRRSSSRSLSLEYTALAPCAAADGPVRAAPRECSGAIRSAHLVLSPCACALSFARGALRAGGRVSLVAPRVLGARPQRRCRRPGARHSTRATRRAPERALCALAVRTQRRLFCAWLTLGRRPASRSSPVECTALARGAAADDPVRAAARARRGGTRRCTCCALAARAQAHLRTRLAPGRLRPSSAQRSPVGVASFHKQYRLAATGERGRRVTFLSVGIA